MPIGHRSLPGSSRTRAFRAEDNSAVNSEGTLEVLAVSDPFWNLCSGCVLNAETLSAPSNAEEERTATTHSGHFSLDIVLVDYHNAVRRLYDPKVPR